MPKARRDSILAIDFGSVTTRALFFDRAEGGWRLAAHGQGRTTIGSPTDDVFVGLGHILDDIALATGRQFFDELGRIMKPEQSDGYGVDYCITTTSAGDSLRAVMVGLLPGFSLDSALRAISLFYIEPVARIYLEDNLSEDERVRRIIESRPDLIFVCGGTDGGARTAMLELLLLVKQALLRLPPANRPVVLYAGNRDLAGQAREMLGQLAEVVAAPNIRPTKDRVALAAVQAALGRIYSEYKTRRGFSFHQAAALSDTGILPTAQGFEKMTAFFARNLPGAVLSVDVGSARSLMSLAVRGEVATAIHHSVGMGHSAARMLELVGTAAVEAWLPFYPRPGELAHYTRSKGSRLRSPPLGMRERYIEYGLLRAGIRYMLPEGVPRLDLIVMSGATLTGSGHRVLDMLLLVDALQPGGVVQVKADQHGALPSLGALALHEPAAVVQLLESGIIEHLGAVVSVSGQAAVGTRAMKLQLKTADGRKIEREVAVGEVWHFPLSAGGEAEVRIRTGRGLNVGGRRRLRLKLRGGQAGVLFDARGRPLSTGANLAERAAHLPRWFAAVTGEVGTIVVPESWVAEENPSSPK